MTINKKRMDAGRFKNILMLGPFFKGRNFVSILLVGVFFLIYILAGGKVTLVPKVGSNPRGFGAAAGAGVASAPGVVQANPGLGATSDTDDAAYDTASSQKIVGDVESPEEGGTFSGTSSDGVPNAAAGTADASAIEEGDEFESDAMANIRNRLKNLERK